MSDEPAWDDIRRAYEADELSVLKITEKFGVSSAKLYLRINAENWPRRPPMLKPKSTPAAPPVSRLPPELADVAVEAVIAQTTVAPIAAAAPKRLTPIAQRRTLVQRLTNAIDTKLKLLERRFEREMAGLDVRNGKTISAADFERDTRTIGTLIKNLEQVTEYDHGHQFGKSIRGAAAKSAAIATNALADEADRIRSELAARLQRFVDAAGSSAERTSASDGTAQAD